MESVLDFAGFFSILVEGGCCMLKVNVVQSILPKRHENSIGGCFEHSVVVWIFEFL
jgi:hypothetical protein